LSDQLDDIGGQKRLIGTAPRNLALRRAMYEVDPFRWTVSWLTI